VLQVRDFLARHLIYPRRNNDYSLSQMLLALIYPIILGLDRMETFSLLSSYGAFQHVTGLPGFADPLRRTYTPAQPAYSKTTQLASGCLAGRESTRSHS
jgi:hypothetical protein